MEDRRCKMEKIKPAKPLNVASGEKIERVESVVNTWMASKNKVSKGKGLVPFDSGQSVCR